MRTRSESAGAPSAPRDYAGGGSPGGGLVHVSGRETDPRASEVTQTQKSAKNENAIFGISASRGFTKVIILPWIWRKKIDQFQCSKNFFGGACQLSPFPNPLPISGGGCPVRGSPDMPCKIAPKTFPRPLSGASLGTALMWAPDHYVLPTADALGEGGTRSCEPPRGSGAAGPAPGSA